ncbi:methyltransferase [Methanotorris formicicus]|uniref:O-methyltransferase family 2 n=1 Tax=Methanotorris formicicus Mc-S-70 TaxID=647171 RepID=H1KY14_9EURY|nr:methyltransferase [Methanotorris formicicus]EHP87566.1 O-methyltransferase family 2 [Methanotorris formicicus Mc-S-70]
MALLKCPNENPEKVLKLFDEVYLKARIFYLLKTAIDLNLFGYLSSFKTAEELAEILDADLILMEYMLKILNDLGLIDSKVVGGRVYYKNAEITNIYLKKDSNYSIINPIYSYFENIKNWENLSDILKNKDNYQNTDVNSFFPKVVRRMADECKCWELQKVLSYIAKYGEFKNAKKLLDLGGGHGLYAIGFSMLNKNLKCYVFDLPNVVEETKKFIEKYNAKNVFTITGDFYKDDIGKGYDIIFTSYNPGGKNPKIAEKVYNSLNEGGLFINKQFFPDKEEGIEDYLNNMEWNFSKPEGLNKGRIRYTFEEDLNLNDYLEYLKNLGFKILEVTDMPELLGLDENSKSFRKSANPKDSLRFGCFGKAKMIVAKKI